MCAGEQRCYITSTLTPAMRTHLSYIQVNKGMRALRYISCKKYRVAHVCY